ncbi:MAG TPA: nitrite/sulfite reductase, partial [Rhodocyclaceae bacterium]|nr:nitrite/sulfite reductase [Rhodocyclaceae bacterium]
HHIGHIGILGVDKQGQEFYQVSIGGRQGNGLGFGEVLGPAFAAAEVPDVVERLIAVYLARRHVGERFIDTVDRIGLEPFRARAYQIESDEREVANG